MTTPPPRPQHETDDPTPLWVVAAVIFLLAGLGGPILFFLLAWII